MSQTGKVMLPPTKPFVHVPPSYVPSSLQIDCKTKPMEGFSHHHHCSSEGFPIEEQPSWLEDLLDDSESVSPKHHRRAASDTTAYLDKTIDRVLEGSLSNLQTKGNPKGANHASVNTNPRSLDGASNRTLDSLLKSVDYTNGLSAKSKGTTHQTLGSNCAPHEDRFENPNQQGSCSQNKESPGEKNDIVQPKTDIPKGDARRAKYSRQSAHRSRLRKLQYIAELERDVQILQAEGSAFYAEIGFRDQHNLILSMENRTMRQRLETLSQELHIKYLEHEMLEREIRRLQALFQLQVHQQQYQQEATTPQTTAVQKRSN